MNDDDDDCGSTNKTNGVLESQGVGQLGFQGKGID